MQSIWQDVRYGLRGLRGNPGFSALAIVTLALGIGAGTTMFSVIKNVLLSPFPYKDADQIVAFQIHDMTSSRPGGRGYFNPAEYLEYREKSHVFAEDIGGDTDDVLWTSDQGTEQLDGGYVTPNTFPFLGVPPLLGRWTTAEDAKPGAPPVFVMAYKLWTRRFSQDPHILGRTFILNGKPMTLVGIMPKRFTKRGADLWIITDIDRNDKTHGWIFQAKLKPGVTRKQAEADLLPIAQNWAKDHPKDYPKRFRVDVISYMESIVGPFQKTLLTLGVAVALLLLIACANVANMLLARATSRDREMAIRAAMGASRWRVIRQLLIESLMLALAGAVLGSVFAWAGTRALVAYIPDGAIPREAEIRLDATALLFSMALAIATALLFGLAPAMQMARRDIVQPLKDSGRGVSGGFRRGRMRSALVIVELALSLVLLTGAGLMMRSFLAMQTTDLGFRSTNLLVARLPFPRGQYLKPEQKKKFFGDLLPRLERLPGVLAATELSGLPPFGNFRTDIEVPGMTHTERWRSQCNLVSESYPKTLGLKLLRGRFLNESDIAGARRIAVVNQTLVTKYFGKEDPVGRQIQLTNMPTGDSTPPSSPIFEIVGVFADIRNSGFEDATSPEMMVPYTITGALERGILVRTAVNPLGLVEPVKREIWATDRNVALTMTRPLDELLSDYVYAQPRFVLLVLGVFAGLGLVLVAVGVYSVIAYTVSRQTREIGIRVALGASAADVIGMVLRMGLWLIGAGLAVGLAASFAANRVLASELFGVTAHDPMTFVGVAVVVIAVGVAACWIPARRATRVDPVVALRFE
jgi:putative ABC transport system permease protein